jgi:hypothetical protein
MRRFYFPLTVCALLGCGEQPTATSDAPASLGGPILATTTEHFVGSEPIDGSFPSGCTGELITFSGTLFFTANIVTAGGNANHVTVHNRLVATATAEPSGTRYSFRDIQVHNFNTPSGPAPNGSIIDKEVGHLISRGSAPDELLSFNVHLVFTGTGEMKVVVDKFRTVCH